MKLIPLTQGYFAKVDDEDYELLMQFKWHIYPNEDGRLYASHTAYMDGVSKTVSMHRFLLWLCIGDKRQGDHIDHDGLNNQKYNLRIATCSQNNYNTTAKAGSTSKYKGVFLLKGRQKLRNGETIFYPSITAGIKANGKREYLGTFKNEEEAALAYDKRAKELHGEFARLNFP